ncbi:MAG: hypothetical protein WDO24_15430 [Pseudomonadota bacterium]
MELNIRNLDRLRIELAAESADSRALVDDLQNNPVCSVSVEEAVPCVLVVWHRYATSAQLRFVHETIIELLTRHGLSKVLGDDTQLSALPAEDQRWIRDDWLPRAVAAGLKTAASKRSSHHFGQVALEALQTKLRGKLLINTFDDFQAARQWLQGVASS